MERTAEQQEHDNDNEARGADGAAATSGNPAATKVMSPSVSALGADVAVPATPAASVTAHGDHEEAVGEGADDADFLENFSPVRGRNGQAPDGYEDDGAVHAAWIADMFQDGEPGTQPHGLQGSSAPPAAERGATGEQHNGGAAASAGGHGGNAASAANGVPGAEIQGFTAETLGIMMRAFSQAASSSEWR